MKPPPPSHSPLFYLSTSPPLPLSLIPVSPIEFVFRSMTFFFFHPRVVLYSLPSFPSLFFLLYSLLSLPLSLSARSLSPSKNRRRKARKEEEPSTHLDSNRRTLPPHEREGGAKLRKKGERTHLSLSLCPERARERAGRESQEREKKSCGGEGTKDGEREGRGGGSSQRACARPPPPLVRASPSRRPGVTPGPLVPHLFSRASDLRLASATSGGCP
eukprot:scaffold261827_cov30-Tisochrysis_lutea.AAC.1